MANKTFNGRIVNKHDTAENWAKATSFIPKQGEIIVYDADADYDYERFKIGDGETVVSSLPFANDEKADIQHNHTVSEITDLLDLTEEEIAELCEFDGNPDNIIPVASKASMGCVVAGDGLDIDDNGVLSVQSLTDEEIESICEFDEGMTEDNVIPKATRNALGCIKVGDGLAIDSAGRLSATGGSGVATAGIGSAGMKLLWENPNPTAEFAAQTITVEGLSDYDRYEVEFLFHNTTTMSNSHGAIVGNGMILALNDANSIYRRNLTVGDNSEELTFSEAVQTGASSGTPVTNNAYIIPIAIYGDTIAPPNVDYTLTEEKTIQELLWTNPSPTAEFAAQTVSLDLSEYDAVMIYSRINKNPYASSNTSATDGSSMYATYLKIGTGTYINLEHSLWNGTANPGFATRNAWATTTGVGFAGGYWHSEGASGGASNNYVIPVEIYGIKNKINVTTAVVTDKGQHTDLLWENASPTAGFAAQTIALDLNGYDEIEIEFGMRTSALYRTSVKGSLLESVVLVGTYSFGGSGKILGMNRAVVINDKTSVVFDDAWETTPSSDTLNNNVCIPLAIYGIKHNVATTSTIMGDYVIEEGTVTSSGITWTYQKWTSGKAECWALSSKTITAAIAWGTGYISSYGTTSASTYGTGLPAGLFVSGSVPNVSVDLYKTGYVLDTILASVTNTKFEIYTWSAVTYTNQAFDMRIHAIGRWK